MQNGSIYRLNLSKSKAVGTRFLDCVQYLTHETEKQQASGKHHYDDSEIKANFDCAQLRREEMRLRYGKSFRTTRVPHMKSYTKVWLFAVIEQNPIAYQNDKISSVWNTLQRPLQCL